MSREDGTGATVKPRGTAAPPARPRPIPVHAIRPMAEGDLGEVAAIEAACYPDPWPYEALAFELKENSFCHCFVAEEAGAVAGYAFLWVVYEMAHLINIAVAEEYRGRGFGEGLLRHSLEVARGSGAEVLHLEVRVTNAAAIALYHKYGFTVRGRQESYYKDGTAAFLMEAALAPPEVEP